MEIENNRMNRKLADEEMEEDLEVEEVDSDEWDEENEDAIPPNDCLFCDHHSSTIDKVSFVFEKDNLAGRRFKFIGFLSSTISQILKELMHCTF